MPTSDIPTFLDASGVSYALIGGQAIVARGHLRATVDFDFMTANDRVLETAFWTGLDGAEVDVRKGDFDDQFKGVVRIHLADGTDTDVIVARWKWEGAIIDRSELMEVEGVMMPVPQLPDLVILKLAAGGPLDLQDIINLMDIHGRDPLVAEVEARLDEVRPDVRDTWVKLLASLDV
jgi:hypothetical protein